jgi:hypothetical protein
MAAIWAFRLRESAREVIGRPYNKVWWNDLRPVHALLYLVFSLMVLTSTMPHHAYAALLTDAGIGLGAFVAKNQGS